MKVQDVKYLTGRMCDFLEACDAFNGDTAENVHSADLESVLTHYQRDLAVWQERNFKLTDDVKPLMLTLGVIEEGTSELYDAHDQEEVNDAIGDTLIFLAQLGSHYGFSIAGLIMEPPYVAWNTPHSVTLGLLAQVVLKLEQNIRGKTVFDVYRAIGAVIGSLEKFNKRLDICFIDTVKTVLERDWVANPTNGVK